MPILPTADQMSETLFTVAEITHRLNISERQLKLLVHHLEMTPRLTEEGSPLFNIPEFDQLRNAVVNRVQDSLELQGRETVSTFTAATTATTAETLRATRVAPSSGTIVTPDEDDADEDEEEQFRSVSVNTSAVSAAATAGASAGASSPASPPPLKESTPTAPSVPPVSAGLPPVLNPLSAQARPAAAPNAALSSAPGNAAVGKDTQLAMMIETVGQVKEGILKDLSRLLDDKLSGLDDVVVELIRSKSENETLKRRLEETLRRMDDLEYELSCFRPAQFGFYKKVKR
ncbi:MAG: hypothetical protein AB7P76_00620 [Candidatus Melainabacteria bacterium]